MDNKDLIKRKLRAKAEARIKKMPISDLDLTIEKAKILMHELEVHQVELEMQNQELREAQHLLEEARDQYTDLFDFAPIGYLILDEKGVIENINLTACSLLGVDRLQIRSKPLSAYMSGEQSRTLFLNLRNAFQKGSLEPFELQMTRNSDGSFTALLQGTVTKDQTGSALCRVSLQDITEIRKAEILKRQHENLQNEKEKIQQYLDHAPVIFLLLDNEYKVEMINQKGIDLLGYDKKDIEGKKWFEHLISKKTGTPKPEAPPAFKQQELLAKPYFESEVRCKNGDLRLIGWTNTSLIDKFGDSLGTLSAGEDITERKKLEIVKQKYTEDLEKTVKERTKELSEALEAEKKINDLKSNFITIASHELRTPITIILSSTILIEKYNKLGQYEKQQKLIDRIKFSVNHFKVILDDFLSLNKLERGAIRVHRKTFDLEEFNLQLRNDIEGILKPGQRVIHTHTGNKKVVQDRKMLRHITLNLLSNAIKYSDEDIEMHTMVKNGKLTIQIRDRGIGIPLEEQEYLFERFFRAKNVEHLGGTGLGLSIVERYLDLLGGSIEFTSALGEGSTFTIELFE